MAYSRLYVCAKLLYYNVIRSFYCLMNAHLTCFPSVREKKT